VHGTTGLRRVAAAACSIALAVGLAGCAESAEPTGGLAIVVGARSNMPPPSLTGHAVEAREEALISQAYLSVVVADGAPFQMNGAGVLIARDENAVVQKQDRERNRQAIGAMLAEARALTPETDLLSALHLAARGISSASGDHTIVVLDSGLSTIDPLDFRTPGLLDADPIELADSLRSSGELPDLAGIDVVFQGLGDTSAPQDTLRRPQRANLIAIWEAIIKAAGGTPEVEESPLSGAPDPSLPLVSPVPLGDRLLCSGATVILGGGDIAFEPNSAVFKDRATASELVEPLAEQILSSQASAVLTGTTANVRDMARQVLLSEQRALAVLDLFVRLGVPKERLSAVGVGSDFPGFVPDHDVAGNLLPAEAALNRKVIVTLEGAATATPCV
jgi:outer membrane protein OmpA-like peptidoglycan-associated protein